MARRVPKPMPRQTDLKKQVDRIVGANMRRLREGKRLAPADVAAALHVTPDMVLKFERGSRGVNAAQIVLLASFFDVKLEQIIYPSGTPPQILRKTSIVFDH